MAAARALPPTKTGQIDDVIAGLQRADFEEKLAALTGQVFTPRRAPADRDDD